MSIASELRARAGRRVPIRGAQSRRSNSSGEQINLILRPPASGQLGDMFEVARLLVQAGVSVRAAKSTLDGLVEGKAVFVPALSTLSYGTLRKNLAKQNISVQQIRRRRVEVKKLRDRLGISQEAFAGRYGLDVKTVRNWEQGRTTPRGPAAILLQLIERDPDKIVELLAS